MDDHTAVGVSSASRASRLPANSAASLWIHRRFKRQPGGRSDFYK